MMPRCRARNELLDIINKTSFAMDDTRLFLDTHPNSREALMFYTKMQEKRNMAIREYTENYGPIRAYEVMGPWPWQASFVEGRN